MLRDIFGFWSTSVVLGDLPVWARFSRLGIGICWATANHGGVAPALLLAPGDRSVLDAAFAAFLDAFLLMKLII